MQIQLIINNKIKKINKKAFINNVKKYFNIINANKIND